LYQVLVSSLFGDAAVFEDVDAIGFSDGTRAVRDDDGGASAQATRERGVQAALGLAAEDDDLGIAQDHPGDHEPLTLAA
jgi:hypothetical protein